MVSAMFRRLLYYIRRALRLGRLALRYLVWRAWGLLRHELTMKTKHGTLIVSTRDKTIAEQLFLYGDYEYDMSIRSVKFLRDHGFLPPEVTILDVGANIGMTSIGLLRAGLAAEAIAIEPAPATFELLARNIALNGLSQKIIPIQYAVGDSCRTLTFEICESNPADQRVRVPSPSDFTERYEESRRHTVQVPSITLDGLAEVPQLREASFRSPSLLWIDVQGYEGFVFRGAQRFLSAGIPTVSEIWPYGILRAGMQLDHFARIAAELWDEYWVDRRGRFVRYPITVLGCYLDELGCAGDFGNVIFTAIREA